MPEKQPVPQPIYALDITRRFLIRVIEEGAHLHPPANRKRGRSLSWTRNRNITGSFFLSSATLEMVGQVYGGITHQRVSQIVQQTVENFHANLSPQSQLDFPLSDVTIHKPFSAELSKRLAHKHGTPSSLVARAMDIGKTFEEATTGLKGIRRHNAVQAIRSWGYEVPDGTHQKNVDLHKKLLDPETPESQIPELLKQVNWGFRQFDTYSDQKALIAITNVAQEAGFKYRLIQLIPRFVDVLEREGIPTVIVEGEELKTGKFKGRKLRYFLTATRFEPQAIEAFKSDEQLKKLSVSPVTQIAGPETDQIPTTTEILWRDNCISVKSILDELGIKKGFPIEADVPTPIFSYGKRRVLFVDQKEAFKRYVLGKRNS